MSNLQDFDVSKEMDQELQHFLIFRTQGEALEVELNGNQAWNNGEDLLLCMTLAAGRSFDDSRQMLSHHKLPTSTASRTLFKLWKTFNEDTGNALETSYPMTRDLLFFSPCIPQIFRKS